MNEKNTDPCCPVCSSLTYRSIPFYDHKTSTVVCRSDDYHWCVCMVCGNGFPSKQATLAELQTFWDKNRIDQGDIATSDEIWNERYENSKGYAKKNIRCY